MSSASWALSGLPPSLAARSGRSSLPRSIVNRVAIASSDGPLVAELPALEPAPRPTRTAGRPGGRRRPRRRSVSREPARRRASARGSRGRPARRAAGRWRRSGPRAGPAGDSSARSRPRNEPGASGASGRPGRASAGGGADRRRRPGARRAGPGGRRGRARPCRGRTAAESRPRSTPSIDAPLSVGVAPERVVLQVGEVSQRDRRLGLEREVAGDRDRDLDLRQRLPAGRGGCARLTSSSSICVVIDFGSRNLGLGGSLPAPARRGSGAWKADQSPASASGGPPWRRRGAERLRPRLGRRTGGRSPRRASRGGAT